MLALAARMRETPSESASGPRYGIFVSLREGIGAMVDRLVERLPPGTIRTGTGVESLARNPSPGGRARAARTFDRRRLAGREAARLTGSSRRTTE